ncbi:hypothetical protein BGZ47_009222 [Haplosporangium gracile]|nr:hypothetical protein BGZ47_009222 [Haplosporangium gracile]
MYHQQAQLHSYMTALQSLTSTASIIVSSDNSVITSTTTPNLSVENTYKTVAAIDLFHYPESDFKDSSRHRAYLGQKSRERATRNFIWRKIQQGAASQKDKERIERKLSQRKNKNSGSESNSDEEDDNNDDYKDERYFKNDISDSNGDDDDDDDAEVVASQESNKKQHTSSTKKAAKKSNTASEPDHKKALDLDTTSATPKRRSNKRADRRRSSKDEILSDDDTNNATPSLASSASSTSSSSDEDDNNDEEADNEIFLGEEERIRFKHNLTFKTDDQSSMSAPRVDLRSWKRAFVQRLDEQDQARSSGTDSTNGRKKQNKQKQKEKRNKGSRDYY